MGKDTHMTRFAISLCASLLASTATAQDLPGFDHLTVTAAHRGAAMQASIWYPAGSTTYRALVGDNPVFEGTLAMVGAALKPGHYPLVILSHGSGGNVDNISWLASALAAKGALVVGVNHPGSTSGDSSPRRSILLHERAADVRALLDMILADPLFGPAIATDKISTLGFSLGGATVLSLAGARLDRSAYLNYCNTVGKGIAGCLFFAKGGVDLSTLPEAWESDMHDARISKTVAVDPAMTYAITPDSIAAMQDPTLLISLGLDGTRLAEIEVGPTGSNLAATLPKADWQKFGPADHFAFLALCKENAPELLKEEGEDPICDDPAGTDRAAIHTQIIAAVSEFLLP
ncbi:MAG: putative dienelactone hydrolase [Pseudorhodobacter sp.]|jgi:predicted dienelactone hydrolase